VNAASLEHWLDELGLRLMGWWAWPAFAVCLALMAIVASLLVQPIGEDQVGFLGLNFGGVCSFQEEYGIPCQHCGMTRSWVWMVRGAWLRAVTYNPAGATLWLWLVVGGVVGGARLVSRRPRLLRLNPFVFAALVAAWFLFLYFGLWLARLYGFNPL
jgi:hypothetical protein